MEALTRTSGVWIDHVNGVRRQRLAQERSDRRRFERGVRVRWGAALDHYDMLRIVYRDFGVSLQQRWEGRVPPGGGARFNALLGIHARACLTAGAIHTLLRGGYPGPAEVHWRTLHELAVVAALLSEAENEDVSEAYLAHEVVARLKTAKRYRDHHQARGEHPLPDDLIPKLQQRVDLLAERFGRGFKGDWGWARPVFPEMSPAYEPKFDHLEKRAGLAHLSPYYAQGSSHVHGGARGALLATVDFRGGSLRLAGPSNTGYVEAASGSLQSLHHVTSSLLLQPNMMAADPSAVTRLEAAEALAVETARLFSVAHEQLEGAERDYLALEAAAGWPLRRHVWTVTARGWIDVGRQGAADVQIAVNSGAHRFSQIWERLGVSGIAARPRHPGP